MRLDRLLFRIRTKIGARVLKKRPLAGPARYLKGLRRPKKGGETPVEGVLDQVSRAHQERSKGAIH